MVTSATGPAGSACGQRGSAVAELLLGAALTGAAALGLAAGQSALLAAAQRAWLQCCAEQLASSMAQRLLANPGYWGQAGGGVTVAVRPGPGSDWRDSRLIGGPPAARDCQLLGCSPPQLAGYDLKHWGSEFGVRLPQSS